MAEEEKEQEKNDLLPLALRSIFITLFHEGGIVVILANFVKVRRNQPPEWLGNHSGLCVCFNKGTRRLMQGAVSYLDILKNAGEFCSYISGLSAERGFRSALLLNRNAPERQLLIRQHTMLKLQRRQYTREIESRRDRAFRWICTEYCARYNSQYYVNQPICYLHREFSKR